MHIGKLSAIVAQVSLTSAAVLAGEEMDRRQNWQDAKAKQFSSSNKRRDVAVDAPEPVITSAPVLDSRQFPGFGNRNGGGFGGSNNNNNNNGGGFGGFGGGNAGLERDRQQGIAAAERAKKQWANRFGGNNGGNNGGGYGGFGGFGHGGSAQKRDFEADKVEAHDNSYPTVPYNNDGWYTDYGTDANDYGNPYPNGQPAPAPAPGPGPVPNGYQGPYGGGAAAAVNWQDDVASAHSVADQWQSHGSSLGQSWATYGSSIAASYQSEYAPHPTYAYNQPGWQGDVSSAQSVASSYRSEYGAPSPSSTWKEEYSPGPTGNLPPPKGTSMVQVNGGATDRTQSFTIAAAMGAAFAAAAVAFGRL
ncbi:hypothetical protein QBC43DRAFT_328841 [Cladorrhinum sp. PSN259]|nr:hypothetical protein QBC43DRAFT_328841 [Cladorrhinum sp. PSN259]